MIFGGLADNRAYSDEFFSGYYNKKDGSPIYRSCTDMFFNEVNHTSSKLMADLNTDVKKIFLVLIRYYGEQLCSEKSNSGLFKDFLSRDGLIHAKYRELNRFEKLLLSEAIGYLLGNEINRYAIKNVIKKEGTFDQTKKNIVSPEFLGNFINKIFKNVFKVNIPTATERLCVTGENFIESYLRMTDGVGPK